MIFNADGLTFWSSTYNQDGAPDDGTISCPIDIEPSSYYYESLIEELQNLWHVGVLKHDNVKNETFTMHAVLMWIVNGLPAYGMVSRWITTSVMGCQSVWNTHVHSICRTELRLHDMKSHDCHAFIQKLIPITFREILPESVWSALIEVNLLFQILCSTTLDVNKVQELEARVAIIFCNLEKIFPPCFFDSMKHLIVHLRYEARMGGPEQYRLNGSFFWYTFLKLHELGLIMLRQLRRWMYEKNLPRMANLTPEFEDGGTTPATPEDEGTSTHWGEATQMDWAQKTVFDAAELAFW
ncbi:UNVERIFIED_CONTAM: hypothetical protein Scaly_2849800 [Sesamum calycinum]|uniref:DUF4218 domain-containing protein n=1 Tax=Sesamum calycinum TaxID=2727403 RepID=A0AAW2LHP8_9LAMI